MEQTNRSVWVGSQEAEILFLEAQLQAERGEQALQRGRMLQRQDLGGRH